jgi:hypothetical protein
MPVLEKDAFGVDHILAKSTPAHAHLECEYSNLLYSCNRCNSLKSDHVVVDPCAEAFGRHLRIDSGGEIIGLTDLGKKIVKKLRLDSAKATGFRRWMLEFQRAISANPDGETARLFRQMMSYPDELPDLAKLRPPHNSKPDGIARSHFARRRRKELPEIY